MKKIILLVIGAACLGSYPAFSQISLLDQKDQATLQTLPDDQTRADTLIEWAYAVQKRPQEAPYIRAALALADRTGYSRARADCFVKLGHLALDSGHYPAASDWYTRALQLRDSLGLVKDVASCYNNLGLVQKKQGQYDSAAVLYRKGLQLLQATPTEKIAVQLHNNLGTALRYQGQYQEALDHFRQSMAISRQRKNTLGIAKARLNLGNLLQDNLNRFAEARDSLTLCLTDFQAAGDAEFIGKCQLALGNNAYYAGNLQEALHQYEQALALAASLAKDDRAIALKNKGRIFLDQRDFENARQAFQASLADFTALGNTREVASAHFEIGNAFYEQLKPEAAVEHYQKALATGVQDVGLKSRLLYFLSDALDQLGRQEEARQYTTQYVAALDSLSTGNTKGAFDELIRHQLDKNRLLKTMALREKQAALWYAIAGLSALSLLLLLALLFARLQRQKRRLAERNAEIARQQEELARQNAEIARKNEAQARSDEELARKNEQIAVGEKLDLLKNKELETNYARLEGQDEMQKKIGQELHDSVGAMLTSIKLNLSPVDEVLDRLPENNRQQYTTANRLLSEASEEVRRISHELSSAVLQKFGLKAQLESLADIIPRSGKLQVELTTHGLKERLDYKTEINIYRMVQELVHNAIKNAQAQNLTIQVNRFENRINVLVEDDGVGFDWEEVRKKPGLGMQNLAARVHDLQGELDIDTRPGRGTIVSIDIPVKELS